MIVQNTSDEGVTDISFTLPTEQMEIGKEIMTSVASEIGAGEVSTDDSVGKYQLLEQEWQAILVSSYDL